jgi:hypothetical protein
MPELFMISPAGFIAAINYGTSPPSFDVFRPIPGGQGSFFKTTGPWPISNLTGRRGTIQASVVTGAAGAARAVAFLVDRWPSPTKYIGIALDAGNHPYAQMSVDGVGTVSGRSSPAGAALAAGTPLNLRLSFNALGSIRGDWKAVFQVEDVTQGVWVVDPIATWVPFIPTFLLVGLSPVGGVAAMNGTVQHVQVSETIDVAFRAVPPTEEENALAGLVANSLLAGNITGTRQLDAYLVTDSAVAADFDVIPP